MVGGARGARVQKESLGGGAQGSRLSQTRGVGGVAAVKAGDGIGEQGSREQVVVAGRGLELGEFDGQFEITRAETGEEALFVVRTVRPLLIALDAELEHPGVLSVLERLRRDERTWAVPTVVVSGGDSPELEAHALELGASDVLSMRAPARVRAARLGRLLREGRERIALSELAQTDGLTGLSNFRALNVRLEQEFKRARRYGHALTVVMIDLDHLKPINDRLGHELGNRAIVALARHLKDNLRESDFAARYGGDEFVAVLPYQEPQEAHHFAERLRQGLHHRAIAGAPGLRLTVSIGIAGTSPEHPLGSMEELVTAADAALYRAKAAGRNRIEVAEPSARAGDEQHQQH